MARIHNSKLNKIAREHIAGANQLLDTLELVHHMRTRATGDHRKQLDTIHARLAEGAEEMRDQARLWRQEDRDTTHPDYKP